MAVVDHSTVLELKSIIMVARAVTLFFNFLVIQGISAQCIGAGYAGPAPLAAPLAGPCGVGPLGWGAGPWEAAALSASHGPGLAVSSASPVPPIGVSVASENAIEGALAIGGAVPFLGTVGVEGAVPTIGAGAVEYGCGNGEVAIVAEDIASPLELASPLGYAGAPLANPLGYAGPLGYGALAGPYGGCGARF